MSIIAFFRAWETAAPYQRGEDVAPASLKDWADNYTFQEAKVDNKYHARWKEILEYLSFSFRVKLLSIPEKPQMVFWRFMHGPVAEPVKDLRPTVDYSHSAGDFDTKLPMPPQDLFGAVGECPMQGRTGIIDPNQRCPHLPGDAVELIVISYAVHKPPGLCSRATSCYAVVRPPTAFPEDPYEDIDWDTFWLHTLKLLWQYFTGSTN